VIANKLPIVLERRNQLPGSADLNFLENVDALGVPFGATHVPDPLDG
jgi:hypothetical protein